jgi:hypothetical protein
VFEIFHLHVFEIFHLHVFEIFHLHVFEMISYLGCFLAVFNKIFLSRIGSVKRQKNLGGIIKQNLNLDVVFMLDCTGSMAPYIKTAKAQIGNIITTWKEEHGGQVGLGDPSIRGCFQLKIEQALTVRSPATGACTIKHFTAVIVAVS